MFADVQSGLTLTRIHQLTTRAFIGRENLSPGGHLFPPDLFHKWKRTETKSVSLQNAKCPINTQLRKSDAETTQGLHYFKPEPFRMAKCFDDTSPNPPKANWTQGENSFQINYKTESTNVSTVSVERPTLNTYKADHAWSNRKPSAQLQVTCNFRLQSTQTYARIKCGFERKLQRVIKQN